MPKRNEKPAKPKKIYGKYVLNRDESSLGRYNLFRTMMYALANTLYVVGLFVPSDALAYAHSVKWLNSLYIILMLVLLAVAVYASVFAARGGKIQSELSAKYAPRRGLDSRLTFAPFELDFLLRLGLAALLVYLTVMAFDGAGAALSAMAIAGAGLSFSGRTLTAWVYNGHTEFFPPAAAAGERAKEDFYQVQVSEAESGGTDVRAGEPNALTEENTGVKPDADEGAGPRATAASEEAEDFYGEL